MSVRQILKREAQIEVYCILKCVNGNGMIQKKKNNKNVYCFQRKYCLFIYYFQSKDKIAIDSSKKLYRYFK